VSVRVHDLDTGASKDIAAQVTDELGLDLLPALDLVGPVAVGDGAFEVLGSAPPNQSGTLCFSITVRERRAPLRFCNRYAGAGIDRMIDDASQAIALVDNFTVRKFHHLHVLRVDGDESVARGLDQGVIVGATGPANVHRGQRIAIGLRLRHPQGPVRTLTIHVRVPRSLPPGPALMTVNGTSADGEPGDIFVDELGNVSGSKEPRAPRTLKELAARVAAIHRFHGVTVAFSPPGRHKKVRRVRIAQPSSDAMLRVSGHARKQLRVR
jgi:hypothetical protein